MLRCRASRESLPAHNACSHSLLPFFSDDNGIIAEDERMLHWDKSRFLHFPFAGAQEGKKEGTYIPTAHIVRMSALLTASLPPGARRGPRFRLTFVYRRSSRTVMELTSHLKHALTQAVEDALRELVRQSEAKG